MKRRVLLVGGDPLYRLGVRLALPTLPGQMQLQEFEQRSPPAQARRGDIVLLCLGRDQRSRKLLSSWLPTAVSRHAAVVIFTATLGAQHLRLLAERRIDACLPAQISLEETRNCIEALLQRRAEPVIHIDPQRFLPDLADLSRKERQVLALLADGLSNRVIAAALGIQPNTVKVHLARICHKLKARNRTQAASTANDILYQQHAA